ncbi:MAG: hypothetical protein DRH90_12470 [Deltaproteobacteria bacterium]|nr:MAG: hypothetical protein DRH90_12470 [Deltaproteobacteria bacterium]
MTIAYIRNADGTGATVQNTFREASGDIHIIDNYYRSELEIAQIFFDHLPTTTPIGVGQLFNATDSRKFTATDHRVFIL